MATINDLPSIVTPANNSVIVVTDSTSSKKITVSDLRNAMVPTASTSTAGAVKIGTGLRIDASGILSITNYSGYTLPAATNGSLGGVIVGNGLTISAEGVLAVSSLSVPVATKFVSGTVKVGAGLNMDNNGVLNNTVPVYQLPSATQAILGGIKVGYGLTIADSFLSTATKSYAVESHQLIDEDYTTANNKTLYSIGPITIGRSVTFTVERESTWTIYTPGASEKYVPPPPPVVPIQEQDTLIVDNYSIAKKIASSIGPITIDRNVTVEIAPLSTWVIF
jgi:hypothetical protein